MRLANLEINSFKSFARKTVLEFDHPVVAIVGPNGSGKSNVVEAIRFVLGEQSMKSMRGKSGTDLIFKGSKSLPKGSRASVTIYFNNKDKVFHLSNDAGEEVNLNYDVISISREVYPDGQSNYLLNGSEVRLKDINNLLSSVHIGSSSHHIISQGEADRILNASPKDRREMVEDALGLKVYQYKIKESERKLERTEENMKEVGLLRREIAPHLSFLKKQVEKIEKGKNMREELAGLYAVYFTAQGAHIRTERAHIDAEREKLKKEIKSIEEEIRALPAEARSGGAGEEESLARIESRIFALKAESGELLRKLGRVEGALESAQRAAREKNYTNAEIEAFFKSATDNIHRALKSGEPAALREALEEIKKLIDGLQKSAGADVDLSDLEETRSDINQKLAAIADEEKKLSHEIALAKENLEKSREERSLASARRYEFNIKKTELASFLANQEGRSGLLAEVEENFKNEEREARGLLGELFSAGSPAPEGLDLGEHKKQIERLKIKLEDYGSIGVAETLKEYQDTEERERFLEAQTLDLEKSMASLQTLIADLKEKIDAEFSDGIKKINREFGQFFALMFGGGSGELSVAAQEKRKKKERSDDFDEEDAMIEDEDEEPEQGIDISVSLPHKKVKELHALSGGERSLVSIALLFAMSQVNPPPFLVLDETDAALDEANSRKYGDMIERLSAQSQLIVVTHNRETMSRAGVLYGVTIGSDGGSKLLSVKFEEALAVAK